MAKRGMEGTSSEKSEDMTAKLLEGMEGQQVKDAKTQKNLKRGYCKRPMAESYLGA